MAVLGRLLISSAERLDLPDFLSIDSYTQGDFKYLMKSFVGSDRPYVLAGFDVINPGAAIGTQNISIKVADSVVYYPQSLAGPFFHGLEEGNTLSAPLVPELRKNSTNYVYLTLTTTEAAKDTRAFWDPDKEGGVGGEFTQDINTQSALITSVNVSTSSFPEGTVPVCIVEVGPNFITSIEDARDMMFRLGTGGLSPDPLATYAFREDPNVTNARLEPNTIMTNVLDPNAFKGGDKNILSLKEWMDVVMTKLKELGGTTYWYEDTSTFNSVNLFKDTLATSIKSKGVWQSSDGTPGLLTWTEDIIVQSVSDNKDRIIRSGNKVLSDNQTMYIPLVRREDINTGAISVSWLNGLNYVNGSLGSFENLSKGDWIKKSDDPDYRYLRVEEFYADENLAGGITAPGNALSIKLSDAYGGISETKRAVYDKGVYLSADVLVADRDDAVLTDLGGDLYWLAMRSDTIISASDFTTTTLSIDISNHDGIKAKVTSTSHGLSDGQRIGISGTTNFDGTYAVEVESVDTFYIDISGGPFADEAGQSAYYATVTTQARSTTEGLQLESANHEFNTDQTVQISDTTNYNGTYKVYSTGNTTFTIPVTAAIVNETSGTATAVVVYVRTDIGPTKLDQGQNKQIGETETENVMSFIGMDNSSQTYPSYHILPDYNTLDGQANYNSDITDNLTQRVSKLTAMMADKAQDKNIKLVSSGYDYVTNTTNGSAQEITFNNSPGDSALLSIAIPSSINNGAVGLAGTLSLNENEVAYITIDRNNAFNVANLSLVSVANINYINLLDENVFILAVRLTSDEVWLWNGMYIPANTSKPVDNYADTITRQDRNIKLIEGGTWTYDAGGPTLTLSADAYIQVPGLTNARNTIQAQVIGLPNINSIAYVDINRYSGVTDILPINVVDINSLIPSLNTVIIARRVSSGVIIGNSSELLLDNQSIKINQTSSDQTLTYVGASDTADATPDYTNAIVTSIAEITTYSFPAAAALSAGEYFQFYENNDLQKYHAYVIKDGNDIPPSVPGSMAVPFSIISSDSAIQVAAAFHTAISALSSFNSIDNLDGTVTVTNAYVGATTDASNVNMGVGFSINVDTQGAGAANYTLIDNENLTSGIKRVDSAIAQNAAAISSDNWKSPVINFASLPNSGNIEGDVRLVLDTGIIYRWDNSIWLPASGTGASLKLIGGGNWSVSSQGDPVAISYTEAIIGIYAIQTADIVGVIYTPSVDTVITDLGFRHWAAAGASGTYRYSIYATSGGLPPGSPGSPLVSTADIDATTIPASDPSGFINHPLSSNFVLTGGVSYLLALDFTNASTAGSFSYVAKTVPGPTDTVAWDDSVGAPWVVLPVGIHHEISGYESIGTGLRLSNTEDSYLEKVGLSYTDNTIIAAEFPIDFPNDYDVAYVYPNTQAGGPNLSVTIDSLDQVPLTALVIARREGDSIIVGSSSTRVNIGDVKKLYDEIKEIIRVDFLDPLSSTLPTGTSITIDNISGQNGDRVLFTNLSSGNNRVYELSGVGVSLNWTALDVFSNSLDPSNGNEVKILNGASFAGQTAVLNNSNFEVNDVVRFFDGVSADFWELSSIKTSTINNNTTDNIFTVNAAGSENMIVSYSIIRGPNKETGEMYITSDGTNAAISRTGAYLSDVGIDFTATINSGNLELNYTSDNTTTGTMKYFVKRWSNSVGGPTGIPNYSGYSGSSIPAAGNLTEIQYHGSGGNLDADSRFTWDASVGALNLNGLEYRALSSEITINDNQLSPLSVFTYNNTAYNHAIIEYSITRNGSFRTGRIMVSNNTVTSTGFNDDYVETSATGITFSATNGSGNVNLNYISTSTGFTGTLKFTIKLF